MLRPMVLWYDALACCDCLACTLQTKWPHNQAFVLSSLAFTGTQTPSGVHSFFSFAWPIDPPSWEGGQWETKFYGDGLKKHHLSSRSLKESFNGNSVKISDCWASSPFKTFPGAGQRLKPRPLSSEVVSTLIVQDNIRCAEFFQMCKLTLGVQYKSIYTKLHCLELGPESWVCNKTLGVQVNIGCAIFE